MRGEFLGTRRRGHQATGEATMKTSELPVVQQENGKISFAQPDIDKVIEIVEDHPRHQGPSTSWR
jgi:hypothetical protein